MRNNIKISEREVQVLKLIAYEYSAKEIAAKLYISTHTAITHKKNIMHKFKVKNSAGIVRMGFQTGLLNIDSSIKI